MLYFTSDLHLGHLRALEIMPNRPWASVDEMNEGLISNYNSVVDQDDTVVFLGDVIMGKKFDNVPKFLPRLNGNKFLVCGNHDFLPHELSVEKLNNLINLYKSHGIIEIYYGTITLGEMFGNSDDYAKLKLCHFPPSYISDHINEYEKRYAELHPVLEDGDYLLHGHTHSKNRITAPNVIHVGVDAWDYKPVSFEAIKELLTL